MGQDEIIRAFKQTDTQYEDVMAALAKKCGGTNGRVIGCKEGEIPRKCPVCNGYIFLYINNMDSRWVCNKQESKEVHTFRNCNGYVGEIVMKETIIREVKEYIKIDRGKLCQEDRT